MATARMTATPRSQLAARRAGPWGRRSVMYGCKDSDHRLRTETLSLTTAVQSRLGESVHGGGGDVGIDRRPRPHPDLSLRRNRPEPQPARAQPIDTSRVCGERRLAIETETKTETETKPRAAKTCATDTHECQSSSTHRRREFASRHSTSGNGESKGRRTSCRVSSAPAPQTSQSPPPGTQ